MKRKIKRVSTIIGMIIVYLFLILIGSSVVPAQMFNVYRILERRSERMSERITKPNILFLFSDEHSFRYMGHLSESEGGEKIYTPNFDKLAGKSTVLTNTYCQMPLCTPSRICTFTGREVRNCGAWTNQSVLRPEIPTMGEVFDENGYETCLIGKYHLGGSNQFGGFKYRPYGDLTGKCGHQWEPLGEPRSKESRTRDAGVTEIPESQIQDNIVCSETMAFLREHKYKNKDKPFFLCASFSRPHFPLTAPERHINRYWPDGVTEPKIEAAGDAYNHPMSVGMRKGFKVDRIGYEEMMKARAAYFACVTYLDEIIGDLLIRLEMEGLLENTIIVYSSDHGEMAGEHGVWWKQGWYEACTRVPLIISLPEQRKKEIKPNKIKTPVQLIDLFPTLCGLTGVAAPDGLDGMDLSKAIIGEENIPENRVVFCDNPTPRWGKGTEFRMIRIGKYKYVAFRDAPALLFDLYSDPDEQVNLINSNNEEDIQIREKMKNIIAETMDFDLMEKERKVRDGKLQEEYRLNITKDALNAYIMPDGKVITADDILYEPNILSEDYREVFYMK